MRVFALILCLWGLTATATNRPDSLLAELDRAVENRHDYEFQRRIAIDRSVAEYNSATDDYGKYNALRGMYENYRSFRIDSAIIVANQRLAVAKKLGEPSKIVSASLNLAEGYAKAGNPEVAIMILDSINPADLADYHHKYINSIYRSAYSQKAANALLPSDRITALEKARGFRDISASESDPDSRGYYTLQAEKLNDAGMNREAVAMMEEADRRFDFSNDAALLYTMGEIYFAAGQREKAVESLAKSSIIDVQSGTKEYRSLILLASILFEDGQLSRAFEYINCAFDDANFSKANLRNAEIMQIMPLIDKAIHQAEQQANRRTKRLLVFISFLAVLLLISIALMFSAFRAKRKMYATIEDFNAKLEEKNAALTEADSLKLNYINTLMLTYADQISRTKDFRKTLYRLLKTSQYDKAMDAVKSDKLEVRDISAFHEIFDKAFLTMFPAFIEKINEVVEKPFSQKANGQLGPELRVIALMKLGFESTDDISSMLHYSPQTIYNIRSSIRSALKLDWNEFICYLSTI